MGSKDKYLILLLLFPLIATAQEKSDFRSVDSLTYSYYISGDWNRLVKTGKQSISSGIDYKFLRQRLGFAYFSKGDFYNAGMNFEKALNFDSYDQFTLEYLYYSLLNSGREQYSASIPDKLDPQLRSKMKIIRFSPITSIEAEFDYKFSQSALRSDPRYFRAGIGSKLGYRISLYQSFSNYNTLYIFRQYGRDVYSGIQQRGYFASVGWNISRHILLKGAYHFLHTSAALSQYNGNLFLFAIAPDFNRFSFEAHGSLFNSGNSTVYQAGLSAALVFPVRSELYIKGNASYISREDGSNFVYNPSAGLRLWKGAWLEAGMTTGNMDRYNDFNGLYVYNTYDPVVFRYGATFTYYLGKHASFWVNYSYESKEYNEDRTYSYNQFSYLGGFKWKM
jgi:hypothetical protein